MNLNNIYHLELQPENENTTTSEASFLDFSIIIKNEKINIELSDERDVFPFLLSLFYIWPLTFHQILNFHL